MERLNAHDALFKNGQQKTRQAFKLAGMTNN